jgi:hypothetical protein
MLFICLPSAAAWLDAIDFHEPRPKNAPLPVLSPAVPSAIASSRRKHNGDASTGSVPALLCEVIAAASYSSAGMLRGIASSVKQVLPLLRQWVPRCTCCETVLPHKLFPSLGIRLHVTEGSHAYRRQSRSRRRNHGSIPDRVLRRRHSHMEKTGGLSS